MATEAATEGVAIDVQDKGKNKKKRKKKICSSEHHNVQMVITVGHLAFTLQHRLGRKQIPWSHDIGQDTFILRISLGGKICNMIKTILSFLME